MEKVRIYAHIIERAENDLGRAGGIMARLADRASTLACYLDDPDRPRCETFPEKAKDFLFELGEIISLLSDSLEHLQGDLFGVRQEALRSAT